MFSRIVLGHNHCGKVPVAILYAYIPIPRHICKSELRRRIIASHLYTAIGGQEFPKNGENFKRELSLNVTISFSITACCLVVT